MPVSSFHGLETALRGLLAQQRAIEVTGHNIANETTPGYSRQRADLLATPALSVPSSSPRTLTVQLGSGVVVGGIERLRDRFTDVQYRAQASRLGDVSTRSALLEQAELAFAEPGERGIAAQLNRFWSAWGDVANDPRSEPARRVLVEQARTLADAFGTLDAQLATLQAHAAEEYASLTAAGGPIDGAAREIASLNQAIGAAVARGDSPNDLLDRRDLLLDQLAQLGQVRVEPALDGGGQPIAGQIDVHLGSDATPIVSGEHARSPWALAFAASGPGLGRLGALADLAGAGGALDGYRADLHAAATALATAVNGLHQAAGGPPFLVVGGAPPAPGVAARPLEVAAAVDPRQGGALAAIVTATAGDGNDVATAIAALRGGASDQRYGALVGRLGTEVADVRRREATVQSLADALLDRRDMTSAVSLDEEMANLVRFQRGYQAAARSLTTVDELLDQIINRTGRVGL
ncbi:flagellar hook-associated protein FlgK [Patulibacter defluvii]|uniref:flagellar hook-associated protein FlgK n=1 Tax=Patulibacter defluvii TaxID=3095358 RepID=UPI002A74ABE8|nr:flagellar hook-associated protein FlgK [Patulibacter sp. DM4]